VADFAELRRLADLLGQLEARATPSQQRSLALLVEKLGATCIPLLGRAMKTGITGRLEAARDAFAALASIDDAMRARVIAQLHAITGDSASDEIKVCALGLLAELGEHGAARFADPKAIQRRSAEALAAQLGSAGDIANAADMMVRQLGDTDVVQMLEALTEVAPDAAQRLGGELAQRLDIEPAQRARIAAVVASTLPAPIEPSDSLRERPTHVAVLVDANARIVVVATRKIDGDRRPRRPWRWRRWAVLIGDSGCIDGCLHEDAHAPASDPSAALIANLCADGYRVASNEHDHARTLVATAARRTARAGQLTSSYYLGRDLLDLRDAHVVPALVERAPAPLARALDLLATGELAAARALLEQCPPDATGDVDGALGACLLALDQHAAAVAPLERAIACEPAWPLHHWNLAAALHRLGDARGCLQALRRFVATSAATTGLHDDPDQPQRLAHAELLLAEIQRIARLDRSDRRDRRRATPARATTKRRKKRS
jgi:tetratricopeptide (TPR) repeat protein